MTKAEIIQIVLSAGSLGCTIVLSIVIYLLQTRHEKELQQIASERRKEQLENEATKFLIENEKEIPYLPWCVIASCVNRHKKHNRAIYTNFAACTKTLQNEILRQANFSIPLIENNDWVQNYFCELRKDIENYKLCVNGMDFLYDNAKYFYYGFKYFGSEEYALDDNINIYAFDNIYKQTVYRVFKPDIKIDISCYIENYFDYILSDIPKEYLAVENPIPPIQYVIDTQDLKNADEKDVCYWVMEYVENIIINIHNRFCDKTLVTNNLTDAEIEYFEDKYYRTLFWLYATYKNAKKENQGD